MSHVSTPPATLAQPTPPDHHRDLPRAAVHWLLRPLPGVALCAAVTIAAYALQRV